MSNLLPADDAGFEGATIGWYAYIGGPALAPSTDWAATDEQSLRITPEEFASGACGVQVDVAGLTGGVVYTFQVICYSAAATSLYVARAVWFGTGDLGLSDVAADVPLPDATPVVINGEITAPAGADAARIQLIVDNPPGPWYLDDAFFGVGPAPVPAVPPVVITDLDAAGLALVPGTADDGVLPAPAMSFEATATVRISPGLSLDETATSVENAPTFVLHTSAQLELLPPVAATTAGGPVLLRAVPGVSLTLPTPAIVAGRPTLPAYWAQLGSSAVAIVGPAHIHAIPDPDPVWDGGWTYPPPPVGGGHSGAGDARWSVRSLPNPDAFGGDYYWLGEPSSQDGTARIAAACRSWAPDASTPTAPHWRSIYPYKPSVRAHVHYGAHGSALTITAGLRFNLHFIEHMWLDWGHNVPQPFTWVIAGLVMDYPNPGYLHTILDAGRDPRAIGVPYYSESQVQTNRRISENLGYRNLLAVNTGGLYLGSRTGTNIKASFPNSAKARMFYGVFNGAASSVGNYSPHGKFKRAGRIAAGGAHRYYTLGRANGWLGLDHASHLVVFEIRFWRKALSAAELEGQYGQLSSTWRFGAYH